MKGKIVLIILFMICANSGIAEADYLLIDQAYMANVDGWYNLSYYEFDQEFMPSFFSLINTVEVLIHTNEGAMLQVNIHEVLDDGTIDPFPVGTSDLSLLPGFEEVARFIFTPPVPLVVGGSYIIHLKLLSGSADIASSFEEGGYPEGRMFINGEDTPTDLSDIIFQTGIVQSHLIDIIRGADTLCPNDKNIRSDDNRLLIAILSSYVFDATTVNPETVSFAGAGIEKAGKNGKYLCHEKDTNKDGLLDLVCRIDSTQLVIEEGAESVVVKAKTFDGITIIGKEPLDWKEQDIKDITPAK